MFCLRIAENILNSKEDAGECVNDAYFKTWNSIPPQRPKYFSAFLGKIVRNLAFDRYSQNNALKRGGGQVTAVLDELAECIPDAAADIECDENELKEAIDDFVNTLSLRNKKIFVRRYWLNESVSAVALKMNMTENSVSAVLKRIRKKLQKYLAERGFDI